MIYWLSPATASGIGIAALAGLSVGAVFVGGTQLRGGTAVLAAAVVAGLVFQVAHFLEHGLQLGYWMGNRQAPPWITPWAETAADGLGWTCSWVVTSRPSIGVELLHLAGNTIFLAALIGMAVLAVRRGGSVRSSPALVTSLGLQGLHVAEHVALTVSVLAAGRAIGLSTGFGELTDATLFTYRIWFHFVVNLVATMLAYMAFRTTRDRGYLGGLLPPLPGGRQVAGHSRSA
jgi:hypothetical protein